VSVEESDTYEMLDGNNIYDLVVEGINTLDSHSVYSSEQVTIV
jgi:hypothetical protein